ncbi:unnamed protein product [Effrenium voratum]|uniref:Uncharacterized protein n=1 Tax=Effrenium voratum TaxID=2562239 RepID=A0AA36MQI9_9DINO|nr:unnamed protein product [Effrenium voratum]
MARLLLLCVLPWPLFGQPDAREEACSSSKAQEFWAEMRRQGLQLNIQRKMVGGNRTAMVLRDDVFYGRAIMKIPRQALLTLETGRSPKLKEELTRLLFEDKKLQKEFNITSEDHIHLLSLAYTLIAERRNPESVFVDWLNATRNEQVFALQLTHRQQKVLVGTSVEEAVEEMASRRDLIQQAASNLTFFKKKPVSLDEASWALAVIMRHGRVVHPYQDQRDVRDPRMYIFPLRELLEVAMHANPGVAIGFQEEIIIEGKREEDVVLQIARRDMPKGEEIFVWPGRLSSSEMIARHGFSLTENPIGIGRNVTQPPSWTDSKNSKSRKEYDLYNCSTLESFELRFNREGYPMRSFVRCYRISWFIGNGWYSPALKNRMRDLNKWPPPEKYTKSDWLAWTQADAEVNRAIMDYCQYMRQRLKDVCWQEAGQRQQNVYSAQGRAMSSSRCCLLLPQQCSLNFRRLWTPTPRMTSGTQKILLTRFCGRCALKSLARSRTALPWQRRSGCSGQSSRLESCLGSSGPCCMKQLHGAKAEFMVMDPICEETAGHYA